jgi:hypothetical protein
MLDAALIVTGVKGVGLLRRAFVKVVPAFSGPAIIGSCL